MLIDFSLKGDALVQQISQALQKRLTFGDNISSSEISLSDTGPGDTPIIIGHNLGKVPKYYIANLDRAGIIYDFNRALWTPLQMQLKCSVSNAVLKLIVF